MKIGIIGLGNMGRAFAKCFIKAGYPLIASTPHPEKEKELNGLIPIYKSNRELVKEADVIFLAVKPHQLEEVLVEIRPYLANHLMVSMVLNKSIQWIQGIIGDLSLVRILPNTPVAIGQGTTAYAFSPEVDRDQINHFKLLMEKTGACREISEEDFAVFSALAGSAPAFIALAIEALSDGAVLKGMKREDSYTIIATTLMGTCQLMLEEKLHPAQLKDQVSSPGGSTIAGLSALEEGGVRSSFIKAIEKTVNKSLEIG